MALLQPHESLPMARRPLPASARLLIYAVLIVGAAASVVPFLYMLMTSLKSYGSVINNIFWPWPPFGDELPQVSNYPAAIAAVGWDAQWGVPLFFRYVANSLVVTLLTVAGVLLTSIPAAYVFARMDVPGKQALFLLLLATIMIPPDLVLVPKVVMMFDLKWYNTYPALIVPFLVSVFGIFLLRQFFLQIPRDLFDAALIDGAGHLRFMAQVAVPLSRPVIVTIALMHAIWAWDEFKWPLLVTKDASMRVLAVGLQQFMLGEGGANVQLLMAFATIVVAPVLIGYFFTQRYFTTGVLSTGIKG
jgi:ABC-type glycerol-3-phosphate transport system permease component